MEIGTIGRFFGSRDNALVYLAWIIVVVALISSTIIAIMDASLRPDLTKAIAALAIAALSYMFGKGTSS